MFNFSQTQLMTAHPVSGAGVPRIFSGWPKIFWMTAEMPRCPSPNVDILAWTARRQTVRRADSVAQDASARRPQRTCPVTSTLGVSQVRLGLDSSSSYTRNQSGQVRFGPIRDESNIKLHGRQTVPRRMVSAKLSLCAKQPHVCP